MIIILKGFGTVKPLMMICGIEFMLKTGIIKLCMEEIEKSNHPRYNLGAVIFKSSRIISSGHNSFRSNSIPFKYRKWEDSLHAEQCALLGVDWQKLKNSSILVMRTNNSGNLSLSYPCEYCIDSLKYVGIKWLYYSNRKGEIIRERI